jgi:hypothetical protein
MRTPVAQISSPAPKLLLVALNGQTLAGGATSLPALAAKWPSWVSGSDIVVPDYTDLYIRNTGGGQAAAVGVLQTAGTNGGSLRYLRQVRAVRPTIPPAVTSPTSAPPATGTDYSTVFGPYFVGGADNGTGNALGLTFTHSANSISGSGTETRPESVKAALFVIADC